MSNPEVNGQRGSYQGDFVPWNGGCLFIGSGGGVVHPHAHYAIQYVVGAPDGLRVQDGRRGPWIDCPAAIIPSRATHSIDIARCDWCGVMFIEPHTQEGRALSRQLADRVELVDAESAAVTSRRLEKAWRHDRNPDAVRLVCRQLIESMAGTAPPPPPSDPRVLAVIDAVRQRLDAPPTLPEAARAVHLSPGRLRHLFVQETGMPLRTFILWCRLLRVWELLMRGETLANAAHGAGFADSAHLSRTSRVMFGLAPSTMHMGGPLSARARRAQHAFG